MRLSQVLIQGENWREVKLTQGKPAALAGDARGNLFVTEAQGKRIWKVDKEGKAKVFVKASSVIGRVCRGDDGKLYAALPGDKRIIVFDEKGSESSVAEKVRADDLAVAPSGKVYFLDASKKSVFVVGRKEPVAEDLDESGGLVFWKDGGTLVVGAGGTHLYAFRVTTDGGLDSKERYYALRVRPRQPSRVAGLVIDEARRLYTATAEGVQVFDPTGRMSGVLNSP